MSKIVKTYDYLDDSGTLLYQVVRYESKDFRQRRPDGKNGWIWNLNSVRKVLYRLPELLQASKQDWTIIPEGEKDVDRLYDEDMSATCNPGGAGKWRDDYNRYFEGRLVAILPDNDRAGKEHAEQVANSLYGTATEIRIVGLSGLSKKEDISDWFDSGHTAHELLALIDSAKPFKPDTTARQTNALDRVRQYIPKPIIVCLEDVEPQKVEWLWDNRIPLGKLSLLVGDPGLGKSFLTLYIAAQVTTGRPWPDDPFEQPIFKGSVIILTAEDDISDTVLPRLLDHDADISRIRAMQGVMYDDLEYGDGPYYFNVTKHIPALEQAIAETPEARLVIIDPITAYLGRTDSHKNAEVRAALAPLAGLAAKHRVAIIGISHLSKTQGVKAIYRTLGSLAFTAAARAVWVVSKDRDNPNRRLLTPAKANLSINPGGLAFSIIDGMVAFEPGRLEITTDEALTDTDDGAGALDEAKDFLRECLKDGPAPHKEVLRQARENSVSERTLYRAKKALGVKSVRERDAWIWKQETVPF